MNYGQFDELKDTIIHHLEMIEHEAREMEDHDLVHMVFNLITMVTNMYPPRPRYPGNY